MSLMECAISVKNCTPCWRWSSLCLTACSPVNTVKARSSPCWICWMSWCHLPLRHCRGSFRCLRSRFVWLCLRPCCLLDDLMPSKSKPRASWARRRSLCWRGHGCVGPCLVQRASTCCKAFTLLGEQSPLTFWLPGIKPSAPVVLWKIGIALSGLIWRLIANSRLVCSPCSPFGIITGLLLVVLMRVFLPYNGRNLPRPLTIGWLLWAMLLSLPDCSKVSHGFEPCHNKRIKECRKKIAEYQQEIATVPSKVEQSRQHWRDRLIDISNRISRAMQKETWHVYFQDPSYPFYNPEPAIACSPVDVRQAIIDKIITSFMKALIRNDISSLQYPHEFVLS